LVYPPNPISSPDYEYGTVDPQTFRNIIQCRGAVMLRGAADPQLLDRIQQQLAELFEQYGKISAEEFTRHLASEDPIERDFWEQIKISHIFDRTFKQFAGMSYFDIMRKSGLWDFVARAFPESEIVESAVSNSRRITASETRQFWDQPIAFHVDSQFFYDDKLSINFWTPLVPCGVSAPGLKVVLLGVAETKEYLEYNEHGYDPGPNDIARMHKFRTHKMDYASLQNADLLKDVWAPEFDKGDILAFTNFTMHATHVTQSMSQSRTSIEVRVDIPSCSL
jgi:hypothetical protein